MSLRTATIEITSPKRFSKIAIIVINAFAVFGFVPVLMTFPLLALFLKFLEIDLALTLCMATLAIAIFISIYFSPIMIGNPYVRRLVGSMNFSNQNGFVVQLIRSPRIRCGFWAFMEDADDIGRLNFGDKELFYEGDSVKIFLPASQIISVQLKNVGYRGFWILGPRIIIDVQGLTGVNSFQFSERHSLSVLGSRKLTKELYQKISEQISTA